MLIQTTLVKQHSRKAQFYREYSGFRRESVRRDAVCDLRHVAVDEIRIICVTRELRWAYGQPAALLMLLLACEASAREMTVLLCTIALSRPSPNYVRPDKRQLLGSNGSIIMLSGRSNRHVKRRRSASDGFDGHALFFN